MIPQQYENLLSRLELATSTLSGFWEKTSDRDKFSVRINSTTILINRYLSFPDDLDCFSFEIMNSGGEIIDGVYLDKNDRGFSRLKDLYESARRNALRIPETISDVVSGLEQLLVNKGISDYPNKESAGLPF